MRNEEKDKKKGEKSERVEGKRGKRECNLRNESEGIYVRWMPGEGE